MTPFFATVTDLADRWRPLSDEEANRAGILIRDASAEIHHLRPAILALIEADEMDPDLPRRVVCSMVKRVMQAPGAYEGITQAQQTTGPFSMGMTFANPGGDLYLTKNERRLLGITRQRAFSVDLAGGNS